MFPPFPFSFSHISISINNSVTVGTAMGSKSSGFRLSIGTQTRPTICQYHAPFPVFVDHIPVPGCTQNGLFSKWFRCFDTSTSSRGYIYSRITSCLDSFKRPVFKFLLTPAVARASMSAHFDTLARLSSLSHFLRSASLRVRSGRSVRRCSAALMSRQGFWSRRISPSNRSRRISRLRL